MTTLELTPEQREALEEVLQRSIRELETEARHTDSSEFKDQLKTQKGMLSQVLEMLQPAAVSS